MSLTHTGDTATTTADAEHAIAFADAALGLAGHKVTDPVLRDIMEAVARGELTGDEAVKRANAHIDSL